MSKKIKERQPTDNEKKLVEYLTDSIGSYLGKNKTQKKELLYAMGNVFRHTIIACEVPKVIAKEMVMHLISSYPEVEGKND